MRNNRTTRLALAIGVTAAAMASGTIGTAYAQPAPPSYVASPDIYKIIAEDAHNVLILADFKPGQRSNTLSLPARLSYSLTDCALRYTSAKGASWDYTFGAERPGSVTADESVSIENVGSTECKVLIFQSK
jgi:hypothetical protein